MRLFLGARILFFISLSGPALAFDNSFPPSIALGSLNGPTGFRLNGIDPADNSGRPVGSAGDLNGDGYEDLLIGAENADTGSGEVYVVFGTATAYPARLALSGLNGANGFRLDGIDFSDEASVPAAAGDFNRDGFGDIVIGAPFADADGKSDAGEAYVVFGRRSFPRGFSLASLTGANGFRLDGILAGDRAGASVAGAGDVNGDGFDDIIIGAFGADTFAGESYVVFGRATPFVASYDLASLNGAGSLNGVRLDGVDWYDDSGASVASAGDMNTDGFGDVLVGARSASPDGGFSGDGESYVVFGNASLPAAISLAGLSGQTGFRMRGIQSGDQNGYAVAGVGDVNGDGYADIVSGAPHGATNSAGESYVVFGKSTGFTPFLDLTTLNGGNGVRIDGIVGQDRSGSAVAAAGDVNGDGFDDVMVGAALATATGDAEAGQSYVVFGRAGFGPTLALSSLNGGTGFRLDGIDEDDRSGIAAATAGDLNRDGFDEVVVGATAASPGNRVGAGESYVVFGRAPKQAVTRVGGAAHQTIRGGPLGDVLDGRDGNDSLFGAGGDDQLLGGPGLDRLNGGTGADRLNGGKGNDVLIGGPGGDTFVFSGAFGADTLSDWQDTAGAEASHDGLDRIDLSALRSANGGAALTLDDLLIEQTGATSVVITLDLDHDGATDSLDLDGNGSPDVARLTFPLAQAANFGNADFLF